MSELEQLFLKAIVPNKTFVYGYELLPFSLGHSLLLQRCDSPLFGGSKEGFQYTDFLEALFVCRHSFEYSLATMNTSRARREQLWPQRRHSWFGLRTLDWKPSAQILLQHISEGLKAPVFYARGEGGGAEINTPGHCMLVVNLMEHAKQSLSQIMNQHLALSWWLYAGIAEKRGQVGVTSKENQEAAAAQTEDILERFRSGKLKMPGYKPEGKNGAANGAN